MTLPTELQLPSDGSFQNNGNILNVSQYLSDLGIVLKNMYEEVAHGINGDYSTFTPLISGSLVQGTSAYSRQTGLILRKGIEIDVWFDLEWNTFTGTGLTVIPMLYKSKNIDNQPFTSHISYSNITLPAGYTGLFVCAEPNTYFLSIYVDGPGLPTVQLQMPSSGRLYGHIRYIGQQIEN